MNSQQRTTKPAKQPREDMLSPRHTPSAVRKRPPKRVMQTLRISMFIMGCLILILTALLVILPMFRVQNVEIEGISYYKYEEILAASGISIGQDESMSLDGAGIAQKILKSCPNVDSCTVMTLPFSVKITIVEKADVKQTVYGGGYITFDRAFHVLEQSQNGESFSPFLSVKLPSIANASVGRKIQFSDMTLKDAAYINTLYDVLKEKELLQYVTSIDFSERFALSFVLDDRIQVELGNMESLEKKLEQTIAVIREKQEKGTDMKSAIGIIDASAFPRNITWRSLATLDEIA